MISELICSWHLNEMLLENFAPSLSEPNDSIVIAINELKKCNNNETYENSNARVLAQQILHVEGQFEEDIFVFFLNIWAITAIKCTYLIEAKVLISKINKYNISHLELKAFIINTNGFYESAIGNKIKREKLLLESLEILPKNSINFELQLLIFLRFLSTMGRLKEAKAFDYQFKDKRLILYEKIILFDNYTQTHQAEKFDHLLKELTLEDEKISRALNITSLNRGYKSLVSDLITNPDNYDSNDQNHSMFDKFHICNNYLKYKKPENALIWAKKISIENRVGYKTNNLLEYTLIRAELSCQHHEVANQLLHEKIKEGSPHYLDNFFYARIELLKGNQKNAEALFKLTYEYCLYYDAIKRLFFELDLSCELMKKDTINFLKICLGCNPRPFKKIELPEVETVDNFQNMIGQSKPILLLKKTIKKYANANATILIYGETGVGKEEVAQSLHSMSKRSGQPFLVINCGAISESLLHSELFGHTKGSYTGATNDQKGIFEAAGTGTVFLDEIGEISEQVQVALLRVLESSEIKPIGSTKPKKIQCKIIAATNKDLKLKVQQGTFREDLYYRINRLEIQVPSLRERGQDIIFLAENFLKLNRLDKKQPKLSQELQSLMLNYDWPGNVRQLKGEMEKLRIFHSEKLLYTAEDFNLVKPKERIISSEAFVKSTNEKKAEPLQTQNQEDNTLKSNIFDIISKEKTPLRRRENIKALFKEAKNLTRGEIAKILNVALGTVTTDLQQLEAEGFILRIKPSASSRTHYFQIQ